MYDLSSKNNYLAASQMSYKPVLKACSEIVRYLFSGFLKGDSELTMYRNQTVFNFNCMERKWLENVLKALHNFTVQK